MTEAEKTGIAAHLYVTLRRSANRVIDVEWMNKNEDYAREVINLARQQGSEELKHYADRYEQLTFGVPAPVTPMVKPVELEATSSDVGNLPVFEEPVEEDDLPSTADRYIGALR